ncbi:MAG: hypothetical protein ACRD1I_06645 [Terriglobia bacterium]
MFTQLHEYGSALAIMKQELQIFPEGLLIMWTLMAKLDRLPPSPAK